MSLAVIQQWIDTIEGWIDVLGPNPYIKALAIILASVFVAKVTEWIICRVVGVIARRTRSDTDDKIIEMLHRPVFLSVVLFGLGLAARQIDFGLQMADAAEGAKYEASLPTRVTHSALTTIAIFIWLTFSIRFAKLILGFLSRHQDRFAMVQPRTLPLFANLAVMILIGAAIYLFLMAWKIDPTGWIASAGIIGLALSFAAKDTLANLFAGVFILADAPYKIGDFVNLDSGERGRVTQIGIRSTRLLTRDDIEITIPNAVMGNSKIINESGGPYEKERIRIPIGVAYGSDIDKVEDVLMGIAKSHKELCNFPEPRVRFRRFGDSSLDFELLAWIDEPVLRGKMLHVINGEVYKAFAAEGIEIPYPKRDVYIKEMPKQ